MHSKKHLLAVTIAAGLLGMLAQDKAFSGTITLSGTHVDFSYDDSLLGLFGTPTVGGDTLFFTPTQFKALSVNSAGLVTTNASTYVDIHPHAGFTFNGVTLTETGNYKLRGAQSLVDISGDLLAINKTNPAAFPASAAVETTDSLSQRDGRLHAWTAAAELPLARMDVQRLTVGNLLDAYTATTACDPQIVTAQSVARGRDGKHFKKPHRRGATSAAAVCEPQQAFIEKRYLGIALDTARAPAAVPLPPSAALFIPGLVSLLGFAARRKA
ncbi:MAG: hypothetical protein ACYDC8_00945 [Gammaproteobacteria bacterium]